MIFPILLACYEVITYLANDAYLPGLPQIANELHTSLYLAQLTVTFMFFGAASMQMILGPITDQVGRRPVLLTGGVIFILAALGCANTNHIYHLLTFRFIQGATMTSLIIAGYASIHDLYDQKKAIHIIAIMGSISLLAPAFGPLLGSMIIYFSNWRWIFGLLALVGMVVITGLYLKMPETVKKPVQKKKLSTIFIEYRNVLCNKKFMLLSFLSLFVFAAIIAWIVGGPFLLINKFHFQPHAFGLAQTVVFGGLIAGLQSVKRLMNKHPLHKIILCGTLISLAGAVYGFITSILFPSTVWNIIIAMMIVSFGSGLVFPIANRLAIESSAEPMGARMAISSFLSSIFGIIGSGVITFFYDGEIISLSAIAIVFCSISFFTQLILMRLQQKK